MIGHILNFGSSFCPQIIKDDEVVSLDSERFYEAAQRILERIGATIVDASAWRDAKEQAKTDFRNSLTPISVEDELVLGQMLYMVLDAGKISKVVVHHATKNLVYVLDYPVRPAEKPIKHGKLGGMLLKRNVESLTVGDWCIVISGIYAHTRVQIAYAPDWSGRYGVSRDGFTGLRFSPEMLLKESEVSNA